MQPRTSAHETNFNYKKDSTHSSQMNDHPHASKSQRINSSNNHVNKITGAPSSILQEYQTFTNCFSRQSKANMTNSNNSSIQQPQILNAAQHSMNINY